MAISGKNKFFMAEHLQIVTGSKEEQYQNILPQIAALVANETDLIANMANITAVLKAQFNWLWVGFYMVKENELVLAPFQGPIACTRIAFGKGVCGTAWQNAQTIIVEDVNQFPGHIACSSLSQSEIVVPILKDDNVVAVLDVDSEHLAAFDTTDKKYLEKVVEMMAF